MRVEDNRKISDGEQNGNKGFLSGLVTTFLITFAVLFALMFAITLIPKSVIKSNMKESADYLCEEGVFPKVVRRADGTKRDLYADSILLGIVWQLDNKKPLESMMETAYYSNVNGNENYALQSAVEENYDANKEYIRYWHGSAVILKPLLMIFNLRQIYMLNAGLLLFLFIFLMCRLFRLGGKIPMAGLALGVILTQSWIVPLSLEYTWCYLIMFVFSILALFYKEHGQSEKLAGMFLVAGMITSFTDFMTTELLTLLVPLLLIVWYERKKEDKADVKGTAVKAAAWAAGYVITWVLKWGLAAIILKKNVFTDVFAQVEKRVGGELTGVETPSLPMYVYETLRRNLGKLFPIEYGWVGFIIGFVIFAAFIYIGVVYYSKDHDKNSARLYLAAMILPYIRFMVIHNHSYQHSFFTYRVQLAVILATVLFLEETVSFSGDTEIEKSEKENE